MNIIDILNKCVSTDPLPPYLHKPWTRGVWTYATNGHILLRVSALAEIADNPEAPNAERLFNRETAPPTRSLPLYDLPDLTLEGCSECAGRGFEHDCPECSCVCAKCHGEGKGETEPDVSVALGGAIYRARYIRLLTDLPDVLVPLSPDPKSQMAFKFTGGEGLLMPITSAYETHIEEPTSP